MANIYVKYGNPYTATRVLSTEADQVLGVYQVFATLIHEWGSTVVAKTAATRTSALNYEMVYTNFNLISNGVHKIKWEITVGGTVYTYYDAITVYTPYAREGEFFDKFPWLDNSENDDQFDNIERKVRNIIHTFCGQTFDFYPAKSFTLDGTGGRNLALPVRLEVISGVTATWSDSFGVDSEDDTANIEIDPDSRFFVRWKSENVHFKTAATYTVAGDYGWHFVPTNITEAAELLIAEEFNDDGAYRKHAVTDLYMDTHRMRIDEGIIYNSTGIIDADVLLMDYIRWTVDWV